MPSDQVLAKWKAGRLHSGSKHGPVIKSRKQAIAVMMSEKRAEQAHGGQYPEKKRRRVPSGGRSPIHRAMGVSS